MPTMAAPTPSISPTCGSRMKLPMPVKRGAFIASTGRYLGTREPRLDRLHALFVDDADHLVAQLSEPGARHHVEAAGSCHIDRHRRAGARRAGPHEIGHVA